MLSLLKRLILFLPALAIGAASVDIPARAQVAPTHYDLLATKSRDGPAYYLVVRNLGSPIPLGYTIEVVDSVPMGINVSAITALGWNCVPAAPFTGPKGLKCDYPVLIPVLTGAILPGIKLAITGTPQKPNCMGVRLLDPQKKPVTETNMNNNVSCHL
jgi:hypothetical protein